MIAKNRMVLAQRWAVLLLMGSLEAGFCAAQSQVENSDASITGIHWKLQELEGQKVTHDTGRQELILEEGHEFAGGVRGPIHIVDSCNNEYTGVYGIYGNRLQVSVTSGTLVACILPSSEVGPPDRKHNFPVGPAPSFASILEAGCRFERHGQQLWLRAKSGVVVGRMERM